MHNTPSLTGNLCWQLLSTAFKSQHMHLQSNSLYAQSYLANKSVSGSNVLVKLTLQCGHKALKVLKGGFKLLPWLGHSFNQQGPITLYIAYLEVISGELQHVPQNITDDLGLPLQNHILIVQRLYDLWLYLKKDKTVSVQLLYRFLFHNKATVHSELYSTNNMGVTAWVVGFVSGGNLVYSHCLDNKLPLSFHRVTSWHLQQQELAWRRRWMWVKRGGDAWSERWMSERLCVPLCQSLCHELTYKTWTR